jgi:hypothetical protein
MVRKGGQWIGVNNQTFGRGIPFHFRRLEELLWPTEKLWHRWSELQLEEYLKPENRVIGVMAPASSGKTMCSGTDALCDYYCFPECTTVLICSTTKERMQDRIFGEIKKYHRLARARFPNLPGHAIDGRMRIVTESLDESKDGRDFRNGIIGVAALSGGDFRGISEFIGIKNKRVRVIFDELQMLPPAILLALSNLDKNPDFKVVGLGNPKETTDALGTLCEPVYDLGGWDGNIDQTPETKVWKTHYGGICIQLVGTDSPNYDGRLGIPLISKEDIDRDIARYGKDSLKFTMMNQGMMPRGQGSRRVLTRQMAQKHNAMESPQWLNSQRTKIAFLDAAFGGVGGDRCVLCVSEFGFESQALDMNELDINALTSQTPSRRTHKQIFAVTEMIIVPVKAGMKDDLPEDQIVSFTKEQCVTRGVAPQNFFFDAGMKSSLVSAFARLWSPQTNPIDFGATPSDRPVSAKITMPCRQHYSKFVTELWYSVRLAVEAGQFRGMTEAPLAEFCRREWTTVGNNKIEVESKQDMKEKFGKSPDLADAIAGALEGARRLGFQIDMPVSKESRKQNDQWKTELRNKARKTWSEGQLTY